MRFSNKKELHRFEKFYHSLSNTDKLFYVFFTTDLLFWVKKTLSFIPDNVNMVLIGAGLKDYEIKWLNSNWHGPIYYIEEYCDDREIWELLFRVNKKNFGWLDIDCFVLNSNLFDEISEIENDVAINCIWSHCDKNSNYEFLNTYFLFININILNEIRKQYSDITPYTYIYKEKDSVPFTESRILQNEHLEIIQQYFADDTYPEGVGFFDTLLVYQMIAEYKGYKLKKIREMNFDNYSSYEIIHVGGGCIFSSPMYNNIEKYTISFMKNERMLGKRIMCYIQTYMVLNQVLELLPEQYEERKKVILKEITATGIKKHEILPLCTVYFKQNQLNEETINRILTLN